MVPPLEFIPVAEDTGLIIPLGARILEQAVDALVSWSGPADRQPMVSVNVSARQFTTDGLVVTVAGVLDRSGLDPARLTLELTESVLLRDVEDTIARLHELEALGVKLAVDDFGTGFSSLAYLQRFPVDALKIDKSFVDHIATGGRGADLARAVVELGRVLGLATIAEGIESAAQADSLLASGCSLGQGYHFARPMAREDVAALLRAEPRLGPQAAMR
jgi:EAL domain-containing protein (putative c-di-GMP-specific phosphodiesterase class I)